MTEQSKIKCKVCCDTGIVYTGPMGDPPESCEACFDQEPTEQLMTNTAPEFLHRAAAIMKERGKQYDKPGGERSMGKTVAAFNAITGRDLSEAEGWLLLQLLKDTRQWQNPGYHADSADDCIAYAALKAEALAKGASHVQA